MRNNTSEIVFKGIAEFILYRKDLVIQFLNKNGYAELSNDAPVDEVNKAVANNMLDENFIAEFLLFQRDVEEGRYSQLIVAIATAVSAVAQAVAGIVISAKNAAFGRDLARKQEQYNKEDSRFYRELAELNAKKEIAIELGKAQTDMILTRDMAEERAKTTNNLLIFGVAVAGALSIAYILKKKNNNNK
tara:strand:+ start:1785 stop:2351 length:567 start_codon:yes stop_codon:yes gene_type:complete